MHSSEFPDGCPAKKALVMPSSSLAPSFLPGIMTFQGALEVPLASAFDLNASCLLTLLKGSRLKCGSPN